MVPDVETRTWMSLLLLQTEKKMWMSPVAVGLMLWHLGWEEQWLLVVVVAVTEKRGFLLYAVAWKMDQTRIERRQKTGTAHASELR